MNENRGGDEERVSVPDPSFSHIHTYIPTYLHTSLDTYPRIYVSINITHMNHIQVHRQPQNEINASNLPAYSTYLADMRELLHRT